MKRLARREWMATVEAECGQCGKMVVQRLGVGRTALVECEGCGVAMAVEDDRTVVYLCDGMCRQCDDFLRLEVKDDGRVVRRCVKCGREYVDRVKVGGDECRF